jgi:AAA15 family ATPase/GTPase
MISSISISNYRIFDQEVALDLVGDMKTRLLSNNIIKDGNINILKSAGIYGINNCGKTSFIAGVKTIKEVLHGDQKFDKDPNLFFNNPISSFSISFKNRESSSWFTYSFSFDCSKNIFSQEKLISFAKDSSNHFSKKIIFERDFDNNHFSLFGKEDKTTITLVSSSLPLMYALSSSNRQVEKYRHELMAASDSIVIVSMFNIPLSKTIDVLKDGTDEEKNEIITFIKNADLSLTNVEFNPEANVSFLDTKGGDISEDVLKESPNIGDLSKLCSTYHDKKVPSLVFDSSGTKKIEALSSYVVEALKGGRTLFIDELDSGLHFKLTRAIVSLFNNSGNDKGQMVFTTHDIMLLDTRRLMRKEQIWFIDRDASGHVVLYPLSKFTANMGTRETSDLLKEYERGDFGALPDPHFAETLISLIKEGANR